MENKASKNEIFGNPKRGVRYRIPDSILESENIKNLKNNKEYHNWDSYLHIHPDKDNLNKKGYEIYSPIFVELFKPPPVELINLDTARSLLKNVGWNDDEKHRLADIKATEKLNTFLFYKEYLKGWDEGVKDFESNFKVSPEIIYGLHGRVYERTLHTHFFHSNIERNFGRGWNYWLTGVPTIVEFETFHKYGFYAGIISKVYELKKLHPHVFSEFEKCNLNHKIHNNHQPLLKPEPERIFNELNRFELSKYLESNDYPEASMLQLFSEHAGKEIMPFCIALLHEIGFLKMFFANYTKSKKEGYKFLADIFDVNDRRIAGNIRIMQPESREDFTQYTSYLHSETVRKGLEKIKRDG